MAEAQGLVDAGREERLGEQGRRRRARGRFVQRHEFGAQARQVRRVRVDVVQQDGEGVAGAQGAGAEEGEELVGEVVVVVVVRGCCQEVGEKG